jgi:ferredoxin
MSRITFVDGARTLEAPPGTRLMELVDRHQVPIRFGCRRGQCTTCRIRVLAGALAPPGPVERSTLAQHELPADVRLTCQAELGEGDVTIAAYTG